MKRCFSILALGAWTAFSGPAAVAESKTNAAITAPSVTTNAVPVPAPAPLATNPAGIPLLPGKDAGGFYHWLKNLGVDTNRLEQLKLDKEMQRLYDWLDEFGPGTNKVKHLLNGKDLGPFYTWLEKDGVYCDPDRVFTVTNGTLRISGQHRGYLATRALYSDYRLVAEYKWGNTVWEGWRGRARNSGLCIHGVGLDKIWMKSIECQIAEGQTGDIVVLDGARLTANGETKWKPWATFLRAENELRKDVLGFRARNELEKPHGEWNTIEILCEGGRLKVTINGKVVIDGTGAWPNRGRILLQSNGAEIFFRRLDLHPLP